MKLVRSLPSLLLLFTLVAAPAVAADKSSSQSSQTDVHKGLDVTSGKASTGTANNDPNASCVGIAKTAVVGVRLSISGNIASTSIEQSSGCPALDESALDAAPNAAYRQEYRDGQAVPGYFSYTVDFNPAGQIALPTSNFHSFDGTSQ